MGSNDEGKPRPASADEQRNQFIQRQQARSADCDVFGADVVWTAEFAQQKWLYDLSPYIESRKDEFIPSTLETVHYDGKYWGVPKDTNAGFLEYGFEGVGYWNVMRYFPQNWLVTSSLYDIAKVL